MAAAAVRERESADRRAAQAPGRGIVCDGLAGRLRRGRVGRLACGGSVRRVLRTHHRT